MHNGCFVAYKNYIQAIVQEVHTLKQLNKLAFVLKRIFAQHAVTLSDNWQTYLLVSCLRQSFAITTLDR